MKWSWRIGRFAGIDVYIHATFWLLVTWVVYSYLADGQPLARALAGVMFVLVIFGCIVLHEFGHALTARRFGVRTRDITLYPIGGVARLERMPEEPMQEFWVALAGPAVNVVIAGALFGWLMMAHTWRPLGEMGVASGPFLQRVMATNVLLVVFNLIPAFPMDGGRVVRALLATRMDYARATQIAARLGQGLALVFGLLSLFGNPTLMLIAFFVWIGAGQEASMAQMKSALGGIPVRQAMVTDFRTLDSTATLAQAVELILAGSQQDFPVTENGRVVGVLMRADLLVALSKQGRETPVTEVMRRDFCEVDAGEMLERSLARLQGSSCRTLPVTSNGSLVGLLTSENLGEFLTIQAALHSGRPVPPIIGRRSGL